MRERELLEGDYDLEEIQQFIHEDLNISSPEEMTKEKAIGFLNRPLRV